MVITLHCYFWLILLKNNNNTNCNLTVLDLSAKITCCVCVLQGGPLSAIYSEDLDGSSGVLFPFYDPDTHMLYIAGKVRTYNLNYQIGK